ncbi:hypothetical protein [Caulobacter sp. LARHSG274]
MKRDQGKSDSEITLPIASSIHAQSVQITKRFALAKVLIFLERCDYGLLANLTINLGIRARKQLNHAAIGEKEDRAGTSAGVIDNVCAPKRWAQQRLPRLHIFLVLLIGGTAQKHWPACQNNCQEPKH